MFPGKQFLPFKLTIYQKSQTQMIFFSTQAKRVSQGNFLCNTDRQIDTHTHTHIYIYIQIHRFEEKKFLCYLFLLVNKRLILKWQIRAGDKNNQMILIMSQIIEREGNGTPLHYSCLENPVGGGALQAAVHGVARSWTRLSNVAFTFHFHALEKEMATHSSVLAWRIPGMGEPGGLRSMGSHRVGHD